MKTVCGNAWFTSPIRIASLASIMRAENNRSSAFATPTSRGNIHAIPYSAINPRREKAVPNRAVSEANRRSQYSAITSPSPTTGPLIAPMTGFPTAGKYEYFLRKSARTLSSGAAPLLRSACSRPFSSRPCSATELKSDMSAPAQNPRPAPVSTITRTPSSRSASSMASRTSRSIVAVHAFSLSGRFNVMVATRSATPYRVSTFGIVSGIIYNARHVSHIHLCVTL